MTLDLCVPQSAAEIPWCAMVAAEMAGPAPESFPNNWSTEHFWFLGGAVIANGAVDANLTLGLESTFAADVPISGDQISFGRIRIRMNDLPAGTYRVYTPFKVYDFVHDVDGGRFRYVEDLGSTCAQGSFDCSLQSNIGPFLIPSATAGGAELEPISVAATGRRYIANPDVATPVTGSELLPFTPSDGVERDPNIFLIERLLPLPATVLGETELFTLMGRLFEGTIVADAKVNRASYASDGAGNQVDVYATGFPAKPARDPGDPVLADPPFPIIAFYSSPCEGLDEGPLSAPADGIAVPLARNGSVYWAQEEPSIVPAGICVEKNLPGSGTTYESVDPLGDQVFVTQAQYTPSTQTLVVQASSSDLFLSELTLGQIGDVAPTPFVNGVATVTDLVAPPSVVSVVSTQQGVGTKEVTTRPASAIPAATGVTLTGAPSSPQSAGTAVTFTAQGQGADGFPYEYRFFLNDAMMQDYSTDNTWVFEDPPAGTHQIAVWVRTTPGVTADVFGSPVTFVFTSEAPTPATAVGVSAAPTSPSTAGVNVVFTATGSGSTTGGSPTAPGDYQYRFWLNDGTGWVSVQDYGVGSTYTLTNPLIGTYQVAAWVRTTSGVTADFYGPGVQHVVTGDVPTPATNVALEAAPTSPSTAGTDVVFTATGTGSTTGGDPTPQAGYSFRFWINDGTGWTIAQDWGTGSYTLGAPAAGNYQVAVWVSTNDGATVDYYGPGVPHVVE